MGGGALLKGKVTKGRYITRHTETSDLTTRPLDQKVTTIRTVLRRAQLVCDSPNSVHARRN